MQEILDLFNAGVIDTDIISKVESYTTTGIQYVKFVAILLIGLLLISSLFRFLFDKKGQLTQSMAATIEIVFVYCVAIVIYSLGLRLDIFLQPLPFVTTVEDYLVFYPILGADFPSICTHVMHLLIIAFLVNLVNSILPTGKRLITWFLLRIITVIIAIALIYVAYLLLDRYVPQGLAEYAPMILVLVLVALILLGSLKLVVGAAMAFVNPVLAILYTFFFSNIIGRALAKAVLSTLLLTALVIALNALQIYAVPIGTSSLIACIPLLVIILVLWYVVGHLFTKNK